MALRTLGALGLALLVIACGPPVTVRKVRPQDVYHRDSASILDSGEATRFTNIELHRTGISTEKTPRDMLIEMHKRVVEDGWRESLLAMAELAYLEGKRTGHHSDYLGATVYAYLFLFGKELAGPEPTAWDPRTRIAADVYNRALARAFSSRNGRFEFTAGAQRLPVGQIDIRVPQESIEWDEDVLFEAFEPADVYEVSGLAARYRRAGLGAPLIALRTAPEETKSLYPAKLDVPATAFLHVEGGLEEMRTGRLRAALELYDPLETPEIEIDGSQIPLEAQTTTAYAHLLGDSPVWQFELAGFLSGADETIPPGIALMEPYRPDAIPVILVHGTASSPGRWAGLFNDLNNDPVLHQHFQFWFFSYNSGNPIAYSAARLRAAIAETIETLDPEGDDSALREMVLIGHSQGGLLVRLAISDSSDFDWHKVGMQPLDEIDLTDTERQALEEVLIFEPVPNVKRAVFIATPHRGSFVAGGILGRIGASLVSVSKTVLSIPLEAVRAPVRLATTGSLSEDDGEEEAPQTAVDNMAPNSRFNRVIAELPMSPDVPGHSIIAVQGDGPPEEGNDGVVEYTSAHLEDVSSEIVVKSSHSVQSNPATVREVRRILLEHLAHLQEIESDDEALRRARADSASAR